MRNGFQEEERVVQADDNLLAPQDHPAHPLEGQSETLHVEVRPPSPQAGAEREASAPLADINRTASGAHPKLPPEQWVEPFGARVLNRLETGLEGPPTIHRMDFLDGSPHARTSSHAHGASPTQSPPSLGEGHRPRCEAATG